MSSSTSRRRGRLAAAASLLVLLPAVFTAQAHAGSAPTSAQAAASALPAATTPATTTLRAEHSDKCLNVEGGPKATTSGARIIQWSCTGEANEQWTLARKGDSYQLVSKSSGKCVQPVGGATANETKLQQSTCTDGAAQLWNVRPKSTAGRYEVVHVAAGRCLDVTGGVAATGVGVVTELWDCTGLGNQSWALTLPATTPDPQDASTQLVASHSGKCLDVAGGPRTTADGARIVQWTCADQSNQEWTQRDAGNGLVQLVVKSSGKCAEVVGGNPADETLIQQATCADTARQHWKPSGDATTGYRFATALAGARCLDVRGGVGATANGALLELWDCTGQTNQTFRTSTTQAPPSSPPPSTGGEGPAGQDPSQYRRTFTDEFDGSSYDTSKWCDIYACQDRTEPQNYEVSDGSLKIWPATEGELIDRHFTTDGKYYQTYGFFEMEAKLPYGKGPWPAFWLYNRDAEQTGGSSRPEVDIMEAYPGGGPASGWSDENLHSTTFGPTVHRRDGDMVGTTKLTPGTDLSTTFHKYGVKWEPNKMTFYFDGEPYYTLDVTFDQRMYILLSYQFGSASGEPDASTPRGPQNSFDIRYVRAWQFN